MAKGLPDSFRCFDLDAFVPHSAKIKIISAEVGILTASEDRKHTGTLEHQRLASQLSAIGNTYWRGANILNGNSLDLDAWCFKKSLPQQDLIPFNLRYCVLLLVYCCIACCVCMIHASSLYRSARPVLILLRDR